MDSFNSSGFPFKLYIIFSFGIHDASPLVHLVDVGGCSSFHLLAVLINLSLFLVTYHRCVTQ